MWSSYIHILTQFYDEANHEYRQVLKTLPQHRATKTLYSHLFFYESLFDHYNPHHHDTGVMEQKIGLTM